jgi:hypothetical protein
VEVILVPATPIVNKIPISGFSGTVLFSDIVGSSEGEFSECLTQKHVFIEQVP